MNSRLAGHPEIKSLCNDRVNGCFVQNMSTPVQGITWLSAVMCHLRKCRSEKIEIWHTLQLEWALVQVPHSHLSKCMHPLS